MWVRASAVASGDSRRRTLTFVHRACCSHSTARSPQHTCTHRRRAPTAAYDPSSPLPLPHLLPTLITSQVRPPSAEVPDSLRLTQGLRWSDTRTRMPLEASLNCDAGESFGPYSIGDDENLFPLVSLVNAACGFHGSDFDVMKKTAELAKKHGVGIGAHPSLPDQQGFGRRVMHLPPDSFFNCLLYQVGALVAFLKLENLPLSHIKCHGQAYVMASKDLDLARQIARIAKLYAVPMLGMPGTAHQEACQLEGVDFVPEWCVRSSAPVALDGSLRRSSHAAGTSTFCTGTRVSSWLRAPQLFATPSRQKMCTSGCVLFSAVPPGRPLLIPSHALPHAGPPHDRDGHVDVQVGRKGAQLPRGHDEGVDLRPRRLPGRGRRRRSGAEGD